LGMSELIIIGSALLVLVAWYLLPVAGVLKLIVFSLTSPSSSGCQSNLESFV
jgi:hypothetical protein